MIAFFLSQVLSLISFRQLGGRSKIFPSVLFLKYNYPKIIHMPKRHILGWQIFFCTPSESYSLYFFVCSLLFLSCIYVIVCLSTISLYKYTTYNLYIFLVEKHLGYIQFLSIFNNTVMNTIGKYFCEYICWNFLR